MTAATEAVLTGLALASAVLLLLTTRLARELTACPQTRRRSVVRRLLFRAEGFESP